MSWSDKGYSYLRSLVNVAIGAGTMLAGSYFISRIKEKQEIESRLDRLEQMVGQLDGVQEAKTEKPKQESAQIS